MHSTEKEFLSPRSRVCLFFIGIYLVPFISCAQSDPGTKSPQLQNGISAGIQAPGKSSVQNSEPVTSIMPSNDASKDIPTPIHITKSPDLASVSYSLSDNDSSKSNVKDIQPTQSSISSTPSRPLSKASASLAPTKLSDSSSATDALAMYSTALPFGSRQPSTPTTKSPPTTPTKTPKSPLTTTSPPPPTTPTKTPKTSKSPPTKSPLTTKLPPSPTTKSPLTTKLPPPLPTTKSPPSPTSKSPPPTTTKSTPPPTTTKSPPTTTTKLLPTPKPSPKPTTSKSPPPTTTKSPPTTTTKLPPTPKPSPKPTTTKSPPPSPPTTTKSLPTTTTLPPTPKPTTTESPPTTKLPRTTKSPRTTKLPPTPTSKPPPTPPTPKYSPTPKTPTTPKTPSTSLSSTTPQPTTSTTPQKTTSTPPPTTTPTTPTLPPTPGPRYCNKTQTTTYFTKCAPCRRTRNCFAGDRQAPGKERCRFRRGRKMRKGCQRRCLTEFTAPTCCHGYWGDNCNSCPGGSIRPCSDLGSCNIKDGTCLCKKGFTGNACEQCKDPMNYGPNCTGICQCKFGACNAGPKGDGNCVCFRGFKGKYCSEPILGCEKLACDKKKDMMCGEVDGTATCVCKRGYRLNEHKICMEIYPCDDDATLCPAHSNCLHLGPGQHTCSCIEGFHWDGVRCAPIQPCERQEGGCSANETCVFEKPAKIPDSSWMHMVQQYHIDLNSNSTSNLTQYICRCKDGYRKKGGSKNCTHIDVCTPATCDKNALCETIKPLTPECTCIKGFVGDGKTCYGKILTRLKQLNENHPYLRKSLDLAQTWLTTIMSEPLETGRAFTLFIPNDRAILNTFAGKSEWKAFLADKDRASQVLRQHILIGKYKLEDLQVYDQFYTLQGNPAELKIRLSKDIFKFKLHGSLSNPSSKAKIVGRDLIASNGMINVINDMLTSQPEIKGDAKKTALELIREETKYDQFESLIDALSLGYLFTNSNITVFAPENEAWNSLPEGTLQYLMTDAVGRDKLKIIITNHIFPGHYNVFSLIKSLLLTSLAQNQWEILITEMGRIKIGGINVTQVNIPCKNGFYHHISGLLVPDYIKPVAPNKCEKQVEQSIKRRCGQCQSKILCLEPDLYDRTVDCKYWGYDPTKYATGLLSGCSVICTRNVKLDFCCPGFYGPSCRPCPGGFNNICNGHGTCNDSDVGKGTCSCDEGFSGAACELCKEENMFGPSCNETCKCLRGICDDGPRGSGECKPGSCVSPYLGPLCDRHSSPCTSINVQLNCHAHGACRVDSDGLPRCVCDKGYRENGEDCDVINVCEEDDNGGCHAQATCEFLLPGVSRCTCRDGWWGDGFFCAPRSQCEKHSDCDKNSECVDMEPGKFECVVIDPCTQCQASCTPGNGKCSCPDCYGTIYDVVKAHPNLTVLSAVMSSLPKDDLILASKDDKITFLAPSDDAMEQLLGTEKMLSSNDWTKISFTLINFHTLFNDYTISDFLSAGGKTIQKYDTFFDGFSVHIANIDQTLHVFVNHSDFAQMELTDIKASNGHIHIINKVLEPFFPDNDPPALKDAMSARENLSVFTKVLNKYDLFESIDLLEEFTVFAPLNSAIGNSVLDEKSVSMYKVPTIILTPSIMNGDPDILSLKFTVKDDRVLVNGVPIVESDILVDGGVLHVIDGLLHGKQKRCNLPLVPQCCDGFYGPDCKECPYCGEMGLCQDGNDGDGSCKCQPGFKGFQCKECQNQISTGPLCDTSIIHCNPKSGNCKENVNCTNTTSGVICQCSVGYVRNEEKCVTPCYKFFKEECDKNAECLMHTIFKDTPLYACVCVDNYHGNGTVCKPNVNLCSIDNGGCDIERGNCTYTPPEATSVADGTVTCNCTSGYVGDGTLCNKDLMDAVARIPQLEYFYKYVQAQKDNSSLLVSGLMSNLTHPLTLFAPISKDWSNLSLSSLAVKGEPIMLSSDQIQPQDNLTLMSLDGEAIIITIDSDNQFYVNGTSVVKKNIAAWNGILHLTSEPITRNAGLTVSAPTHTSSTNTLVIIGCVVGVAILIGLAMTAAVFLYKRARDHGSLNFFKSQSDGSISFARLQAQDSDSDSFRGSDSAKYDNPVFEDLEELQILT